MLNDAANTRLRIGKNSLTFEWIHIGGAGALLAIAHICCYNMVTYTLLLFYYH